MDNAVTALVQTLSPGWLPSHSAVAEEFLRVWKRKFSSPARDLKQAERTFSFITNLSQIRLRNLDEVMCFLIGTDTPEAVETLKELWNSARRPGRQIFIFAVSESAFRVVNATVTAGRCLILQKHDLVDLFTSNDPISSLKNQLRQQLSRRQLNPYNILRPPQNNMFFGRKNELNRLVDEDDVSFAITGPGGIGKTSLVRQYERTLITLGDSRTHTKVRINFRVPLLNTQDAVARSIAFAIEPSQRADRMTVVDLFSFLRYQNNRLQKPIELLCDEVDSVCEGEAFQVLGTAALAGYCRLLLCGRGRLLKLSTSAHSAFERRLTFMRLEPLDRDSAKGLIQHPLEDIGCPPENAHVIEEILSITGCLPHLLQFYGKKLIDLALAEDSKVITLRHLDTLRWDFETAAFFTEPLQNLEDVEVRLLALLILNDGQEHLTLADLTALAVREGLNISHTKLVQLASDLVINNVLTWRPGGSYRIANTALPYYARALGYLDKALAETRKAVKPQLSAGGPIG